MSSAMRWAGAVAVAGVAVSIARRTRVTATAIPAFSQVPAPSPDPEDIDEKVANQIIARMQAQGRAQLQAIAGTAASLVLTALLAAWLFAVPSTVRQVTLPTQFWVWVPLAWTALGGRFSGSQTVTFNAVMLALCGSLTVALAAGKSNLLTTRDQVISHTWRLHLELAANAAATAAVVAAVLCWAGPLTHDSVGPNIAAAMITFLAVLLVTAIRQERNPITDAAAIRNYRARLKTIDTRRTEIAVPTLIDKDSGKVAKPSTSTLIVRGLTGGTVLGLPVALATAVIGEGADALTREHLMTWPKMIGLVVMLSLTAGITACAMGANTAQRWSANRTSWPANGRRWTTVGVRSLEVGFFVLVTVVYGQGRAASTIMLFVFFLGTGTVIRSAIAQGRQQRDQRWIARRMSEPLWQRVLCNLQQLEEATQTELDDAQTSLRASKRLGSSPAANRADLARQ
ncbi:MAG: hypothetical protein JWN03_3239 [Nocardia sp.]|uniref:hypothetical protein n=1 Tax=Nocardia sp. TaxID=1821 RepID=UPI00261858C3|nr:hypothetical protein [Nocardia sp.]MCU1642964.1 hypothetical protein [Nocardia sp.]